MNLKTLLTKLGTIILCLAFFQTLGSPSCQVFDTSVSGPCINRKPQGSLFLEALVENCCELTVESSSKPLDSLICLFNPGDQGQCNTSASWLAKRSIFGDPLNERSMSEFNDYCVHHPTGGATLLRLSCCCAEATSVPPTVVIPTSPADTTVVPVVNTQTPSSPALSTLQNAFPQASSTRLNMLPLSSTLPSQGGNATTVAPFSDVSNSGQNSEALKLALGLGSGLTALILLVASMVKLAALLTAKRQEKTDREKQDSAAFLMRVLRQNREVFNISEPNLRKLEEDLKKKLTSSKKFNEKAGYSQYKAKSEVTMTMEDYYRSNYPVEQLGAFIKDNRPSKFLDFYVPASTRNKDVLKHVDVGEIFEEMGKEDSKILKFLGSGQFKNVYSYTPKSVGPEQKLKLAVSIPKDPPGGPEDLALHLDTFLELGVSCKMAGGAEPGLSFLELSEKINNPYNQDSTPLERRAREADLKHDLARLRASAQHRIVTPYAVHSSTLVSIMPLIPKDFITLRRFIFDGPVKTASEMIGSLACSFSTTALSLSYLHSKQILHFDLHFDNLLINPSDGRLIVVDFGCARVKNWEFDRPFTFHRMFVTPSIIFGQQQTEKTDNLQYVMTFAMSCCQLMNRLNGAGDLWPRAGWVPLHEALSGDNSSHWCQEAFSGAYKMDGPSDESLPAAVDSLTPQDTTSVFKILIHDPEVLDPFRRTHALIERKGQT